MVFYFGGTGGQSSNILDQIRPFRGYRGINMITPQFNSNYHSLQVSLRKSSGPVVYGMNYVYSKGIDNTSGSENQRTSRGIVSEANCVSASSATMTSPGACANPVLSACALPEFGMRTRETRGSPPG